MLRKKIALSLLAAGALLAASGAGFAQVGSSLQVEAKLIDKYTLFVGTQQNAISLVNGLRQGTEVTLQPYAPGCLLPPPPPPVITPPPPPPPTGGPGLPGLPGSTPPPPPPAPALTPPPGPVYAQVLEASFTPPTGVLGYGNVDIAANLAQQQLVKAGFEQATPEQLKASFMGGTIKNCKGEQFVLRGILTLRASKMGWPRIASELGLQFSD